MAFSCIVDQEDVNETNMTEIYEKLILSNSIVMSKSEICIKLKHTTKISKLRDNIISTLVNDKLLIEGKWFAIKRANGNISLMPGYLKTFPKDDIRNQQDFSRLLTKYGIHYHDFEQSFKRKKTDSFPRTLDVSDIKYNSKWLFSVELADIIMNNSFLRERISVDPSAIIQETNGKNYINLLWKFKKIFPLQFHQQRKNVLENHNNVIHHQIINNALLFVSFIVYFNQFICISYLSYLLLQSLYTIFLSFLLCI